MAPKRRQECESRSSENKKKKVGTFNENLESVENQPRTSNAVQKPYLCLKCPSSFNIKGNLEWHSGLHKAKKVNVYYDII